MSEICLNFANFRHISDRFQIHIRFSYHVFLFFQKKKCLNCFALFLISNYTCFKVLFVFALCCVVPASPSFCNILVSAKYLLQLIRVMLGIVIKNQNWISTFTSSFKHVSLICILKGMSSVVGWSDPSHWCMFEHLCQSLQLHKFEYLPLTPHIGKIRDLWVGATTLHSCSSKILQTCGTEFLTRRWKQRLCCQGAMCFLTIVWRGCCNRRIFQPMNVVSSSWCPCSKIRHVGHQPESLWTQPQARASAPSPQNKIYFCDASVKCRGPRFIPARPSVNDRSVNSTDWHHSRRWQC